MTQAIVVFIFSGFFSLVVQTLLIREMLTIFQGNEISIGIMLSHWLLGSAAGNILVHLGSFKRRFTEEKALRISYLIALVAVPVFFLAIRDLRALLGLIPGEAVSLKTTAWSSFLIIFPLSALFGGQFSLGAQLMERKELPHHATSGYLWEAVGFITGGILFTYVLLPHFNSSGIVLVLVVLCLCLFASSIPRFFRLPVLGTALLIIVLLPQLSGMAERATLARLYRGYTVEESLNSPYGQLVFAERYGERYFFSDGIPLLTIPSMDIIPVEESVHFPLLFHRNPKKVLLVGGSGKYIDAILQHPVEKLDYAELDPFYLTMLEKYWRKYEPGKIANPRLRTHYLDGRRFLRNTKEKYDVILIGVPYPTNLSLNRFYTYQFFSLARRHLAQNGIIALSLPGSLVYLDSAMAELNDTIENTLRHVYSVVRIIPGDTNILVASNAILGGRFDLKQRLAQRHLSSTFMTPEYIDYRTDYERQRWFKSELRRYGDSHLMNSDFQPHGMLESLMYWQSIFAPNTAVAYHALSTISWFLFGMIAVFLFVGRFGPLGTSCTSGFAGMGLQLLSIWGLQIYSGDVYHWIGALSACFMAGTALGAWATRKYPSEPRGIFQVEFLFVIWIAVWWFAVRSAIVLWPMFFLFSLGSGFLIGLEFPLLSTMYSAARNSMSESVGMVYAFDLLGGWLAAALGGAVLIPVWGFDKTILFILLIKLVSLRWWTLPSRQ